MSEEKKRNYVRSNIYLPASNAQFVMLWPQDASATELNQCLSYAQFQLGMLREAKEAPPEAQPASPEMEHEINTALDLHPISIRLPKALIDRYKAVAAERGLIYQPLMREALAAWIELDHP